RRRWMQVLGGCWRAIGRSSARCRNWRQSPKNVISVVAKRADLLRLPILGGPYKSAPDGATWRSGYAAVCKTVYTSSVLVVASIHIIKHLARLHQKPRELSQQAACQPSGNGISGQALRSLSLAARGGGWRSGNDWATKSSSKS